MPAAVFEVGWNWLPLSKTNEIYAPGSSTLKKEIVFSDPDQVRFNDCCRILSPSRKKNKNGESERSFTARALNKLEEQRLCMSGCKPFQSTFSCTSLSYSTS